MKLRQSQLARACLFIVSMGVLVSIMALIFADHPAVAVWESLCVATLVLLIPVAIALLGNRLDPFEPIYIVSVAYLLYFVYAPANDILHREYQFFGRNMLASLPRGTLYASLGMLSMMIGYYSYRTPLRSLSRRISAPLGASAVISRYGWGLTLTAVLFFGAYVSTSRLSLMQLLTLGQLGGTVESRLSDAVASPFQNYLKSTIECFVPAFMILYVFGRLRSRWLWTFFVLVLLVYTTLGFRYRVMIFVAAPIVYHYLKHRRRPSIGALLAAACLAVIGIGGIGMLRQSFRRGVQVDVGALSIGQAQETFTSRLGIYQPFMGIVDAIPSEHAYFGWSPFTYLVLQPIPRAIWPEKPEAPIRDILSVPFGEGAAKTGIFYPNIGEYYASFGLVGVVIGMLVFGAFMRILYEYVIGNPESEWARMLYSIALPFLVQVVSRGYFVQIVQEAAFLIGPILLGMWFVRRHAKRPVLRPPAYSAGMSGGNVPRHFTIS